GKEAAEATREETRETEPGIGLSEAEKNLLENPERISASEFTESFDNPEFREILKKIIADRDDQVKGFMKLHGLLVRDMKDLEEKGEIEGYTVSKNIASSLSRQLKSMGD